MRQKIACISMLFVHLTLVYDCLFASAQASITITQGDLHAEANDGNFPAAIQNFSVTAFPTSVTFNAADGVSYSNNVVNWSVIGGQTVFSVDSAQKRSGSSIGSADSYAESFESVHFILDTDATYELSGYYNITDLGAGDTSWTQIHTALWHVDAGGFNELFYNDQVSGSTHSEQFVLGEAGGDHYNVLLGSLTGNLTAAHEYYFYFVFRSETFPTADSGATAVANFTLKIDIIPEPSSALLCLAGIFATQLSYNRKRSLKS